MLRLALGAALLATVAAPAVAQTTEDKLAQLDARITRLEDLNAIERLQKAYGYFVDKGQWTHLSELFTDDATRVPASRTTSSFVPAGSVFWMAATRSLIRALTSVVL